MITEQDTHSLFRKYTSAHPFPFLIGLWLRTGVGGWSDLLPECPYWIGRGGGWRPEPGQGQIKVNMDDVNVSEHYSHLR